jgi:hypothetical protein
VAADYGIGITQVRHKLGLRVDERLRHRQIALNTIEEFQKAKRL